MGGHGAMISFLKNPNKYRSVSAFAPISNPINCDWGKNAFSGYLGSDQEAWNAYDSCYLIKQYSGPDAEILVDQGLEDNFLKQNQLNPQNLIVASQGNERIKINLKNREVNFFFQNTIFKIIVFFRDMIILIILFQHLYKNILNFMHSILKINLKLILNSS